MNDDTVNDYSKAAETTRAILHYAAQNLTCDHGHDMTADNIIISEYGQPLCATCRRDATRQAKVRTIARRRPREQHPGIIG